MKYILFLLFTTIAAPMLKAQAPTELSELQWLVGKWDRTDTKGKQTAYEKWEMTENQLVGEGVTMKKGKPIFVEQLTVISQGGKLFYVAEVGHNEEPTYFEITELSAQGFVCENYKHDFPKKIEYVLNDDELTVTISAGEKALLFAFKKEG